MKEVIQLPDMNNTTNYQWSTYTVPTQTYNITDGIFEYNPTLTNVASECMDTRTYIRNIVEEVLSSSRIEELDKLKGKIGYLESLMEDLRRKIEALTETILFDKQS